MRENYFFFFHELVATIAIQSNHKLLIDVSLLENLQTNHGAVAGLTTDSNISAET